jgi:hypothetical protein
VKPEVFFGGFEKVLPPVEPAMFFDRETIEA